MEIFVPSEEKAQQLKVETDKKENTNEITEPVNNVSLQEEFNSL
jgi:hypothetical protein